MSRIDSSLRRRLTAVALATAVLAGLTGCDLFAPQETLDNEATIPGVSTQVGQVYVGNVVLLVETGTDGPASVVTTLVNESGETQTLQISHGSTTETVSLDPSAVVQIGSSDGQSVTFPQVTQPAGGLEAVSFQSGGDAVTLQVPVVNTELPWYSDLTP